MGCGGGASIDVGGVLSFFLSLGVASGMFLVCLLFFSRAGPSFLPVVKG